MTDPDRALAALSDNEPIDWLLGRVLRARVAKGETHFLFEALDGKNPHALKAWNAWIAEFRGILRNPDEAAKKADAELSTSRLTRVDDFMAEVFAALHLSRNGYTDLKVVLAEGEEKSVDYTAIREEKRVRIEVKNLCGPTDFVQAVALTRWKECRTKHPDEFNFTVLLTYSHFGPLTSAAISRLKNAIDETPNLTADERRIVLDGDIPVTIKRIKLGPGKEPGLSVQSSIRSDDLEFNLSELQLLFVKVFRIVGEASEKFFGKHSDPEAENVIVMKWESPSILYDAETPRIVQQAVEEAFTAVGLQMKIIILASYPEPNFKFAVQG